MLDVAWALRFDALTAVMLIVVNRVSFMVHVYSVGYMHHDPLSPAFPDLSVAVHLRHADAGDVRQSGAAVLRLGRRRSGLLPADRLLVREAHRASAAAIKAFVVNRVGDFGFALGIFGIFVLFGTINFDADLRRGAGQGRGRSCIVFGIDANAMTAVCLLLFVGAMGKSAQLGLHTWLPDAMEGPTPVSALIHAATMVTAGVFMVARMSPLVRILRRRR